MAPDETLKTLRELREQNASMVQYYGASAEKLAQNVALAAAGLAPIHSENTLKWDAEQGARYQRFVEVLDALIAQHGDQDIAEAA